MKKTLVASILGLATAVSVLGQSRIQLDTYASSPIGGPYPLIRYGNGSPGPLGAPITGGLTVGFYYSTTSASFEGATTQGGYNINIPGGAFVLATGPGSTAQIVPTYPGLFNTAQEFVIPGIVNTAYIVVVAYYGPSYADSIFRGHSSVFTVAPNTTPFGPGPGFGANMGGFYVGVPEPSVTALSVLGTLGLLLFRRRSD